MPSFKTKNTNTGEDRDPGKVTNTTPIEETWKQAGITEEDMKKIRGERIRNKGDQERQRMPESPLAQYASSKKDKANNVVDMDLDEARRLLAIEMKKQESEPIEARANQAQSPEKQIDTQPAPQPEEKKPGFFARLFRKK